VQGLIKDAQQKGRPAFQGDEGARVEHEPSHAACPARPALLLRCLR
jgi:hypothetical protein